MSAPVTPECPSDRTDWYIPASLVANRTLNPIRAIVDKIKIPQNSDKQLIPLSIGDPTVFGNLNPPESLIENLCTIIKSKKHNGYAPSTGTVAARTAIAQKYSVPDFPLTPADVIITSGCSGALAIAIEAIGNEGDNILIPRPGFSLYQTIAGYRGIETRSYNLLPEKNWEIDIDHVISLIDSRTRCIVINNPSNPNGSNFSKQHLLDILKVCEQYKVLVIADEIYGDMVFSGHTFYPMAALSTTVPILTVGGIAKQFVVPGWRVGWIVVHDRGNKLTEVREAMNTLTQVILGSNTLIQGVLPDLLHHTESQYYIDLLKTLETQALFLYEKIGQIDGLKPIEPQGAMYLMVQIDTSKFEGIANDSEFAQQLLNEELVFVLPGSCFQAPDFVRLVVCAPIHILQTAVERMEAFCQRHRKQTTN